MTTAFLSPERATARGDDVRRQGRLREGLDTVKLVTQLMQGGHVRGSASQLLCSIEARGSDRVFWVEAAPRLAGTVFLAAA